MRIWSDYSPLMKYSLRSLMIVVTLICVIVGGRVEYLRRQAAYHEREADRLAQLKRPTEGEYIVWSGQDWAVYARHRRLANEYRTALSRPWRSVDTQMTPSETEASLDSYVLSREGTL